MPFNLASDFFNLQSFNLAFIKPFIIIFGLPRNYIQNFSIWVEKRSDLCYNLLNMKDHVTNLSISNKALWYNKKIKFMFLIEYVCGLWYINYKNIKEI